MDIYEQLLLTEKAIKETEIHLRLVKNSIETANRDEGILLASQRLLEENIVVLKTKFIITVLVEFKKATSDLELVRAKLARIRLDQNTNYRHLKDTEVFLEEKKRLYAKLLKNSRCTVVDVEFRSKNGQK